MELRSSALALLVVALGGCGSSEAGLQVSVWMRSGAESAGPRVVQSGTTAITVDAAHVNVASIELLACQPDGGVAGRLRDFLFPVAHAHTMGTPTRIGAPHVVSLTDPAAFFVGRFAPPPGRYCALRVSLAPADVDANGLPDTAFVDRTARLRGTPGESAPAFESVSDATRTATVSLEPPVELSAGAPTPRLTLVLSGANTLTEVVMVSRDQAAATLLESVRRDARVERMVEPPR